MTSDASVNLKKAIRGEYYLPILSIFREAWDKINGLKKSFWGGFALFFLTMLVAYLFLGLLLALYDFFVLYPNYSSTHLQLKVIIKFFTGAATEVLRFLLSASLAYMALNRIRGQVTKPSMVYSFSLRWKTLGLIAFFLYVFNTLLFLGTHYLFKFLNEEVYLSNFEELKRILEYSLPLVLFILVYIYTLTGAFMASLLALDQCTAVRMSIVIAFKAIHQRLFKNIMLTLLTSVGLFILTLLSFGVGLIWLLPMVSLVIAIQYHQIFCKGPLTGRKGNELNSK